MDLPDAPDDIPPEFAEYYRLGRRGGQTDEAMRSAIAEMVSDNVALTAGRCPRCGGGVSRDRDPNQGGAMLVKGSWFRYRCPCGYLCSRVEPVDDSLSCC